MNKNNHLSALILLVLILAAVITRNVGFNNPHPFTFDEGLYAQLGFQLKDNPINYTSRPTYQYYTSRGRKLPDYLNRPLFKHPPLYSYLISLTFYFTANSTYKTIWSISLISGVSLILLTYLLGKMLYSKNVGLLAAFLLLLDPIHWLCTQKLWMETTVAALFLLSLFCIIKAVKEGDYGYFYLGGVATGCAILTKYTAFLIFPIGLTLVLIYDKGLLKSKHFWSWPLISFLFFAPWLFWNYKIYGAGFITQTIGAHSEIKSHLSSLVGNWRLLVLLFLVITGIALLFKLKKGLFHLLMSSKVRAALLGAAILALFAQPYMLKGLMNMFNLDYVPANGWTVGMFGQEPWFFYLRRLLELSPFYIFAFGTILFLINPEKNDKALIAAGAWIMAIAILWTNYQCRYILSAVPILLLLAARTMIWVWAKLKERDIPKVTLLVYRAIFMSILAIFLTKLVFIDIFLSLPNKTCYF